MTTPLNEHTFMKTANKNQILIPQHRYEGVPRTYLQKHSFLVVCKP
ncbi:hypothetical protein [uncultured Flavobacterium sp.]|nr:hypothetical protein [uncultured Flavobacterium sp.]